MAAGYHPVIIGKRGHIEVRGLTEDLVDFDVVLSEADVFELQERPRFGIAAQTTQPIDKVRQLVDVIRSRFPESEVLFADTVCHPTKQRQTAAMASLLRSARLRSLGSSSFLRSRIDFGVTSTSSSSSI